jgi:hypothetical protein
VDERVVFTRFALTNTLLGARMYGGDPVVAVKARMWRDHLDAVALAPPADRFVTRFVEDSDMGDFGGRAFAWVSEPQDA